MPHDIFLSYSRANTDIMQRVYKSLSDADFYVWVDKTGIQVGEPSWKVAIEEAIDKSKYCIVLFSPSAKQSKWVRFELDYAELHNKPIFVILADGAVEDAIPFGYVTHQRIDIRENYTQSINKLITGLQDIETGRVKLDDFMAKQPNSTVVKRTPRKINWIIVAGIAMSIYLLLVQYANIPTDGAISAIFGLWIFGSIIAFIVSD